MLLKIKNENGTQNSQMRIVRVYFLLLPSLSFFFSSFRPFDDECFFFFDRRFFRRLSSESDEELSLELSEEELLDEDVSSEDDDSCSRFTAFLRSFSKRFCKWSRRSTLNINRIFN